MNQYREKCICLICLTPNQIWLDFFSTFIEYDVYFIIDNNDIDFKLIFSEDKYQNIHFVHIENDYFKETNYIYASNFYYENNFNGWDKVIFFVCQIKQHYKNIWIMEDDVFFLNERTLLDIDIKYPDADLLSSDIDSNLDGEKESWHWGKIKIDISPPYYKGMMCMVRVSEKLSNFIKQYVEQNKRLFYVEALFPTIAKQNNLVCIMPEEMKAIWFRHNFTLEDINQKFIYHPIKDLNIQNIFRRIMNLNTKKKKKKFK